jgi:uncharacterized membrane protein
VTESSTAPLTPEQDTERLKTLTDGVFAIAMTLLVLDIRVPESSAHLDAALRHEIPTILSVAISFVLCGVFWYGHRNEFLYIRRVNHQLIWINIAFLLLLSLIPFSTALLGRFPSDRLAVQVYGLNLCAAAVVHAGIWWYATSKRRLVEADLDPVSIRIGTELAVIAPALYLVALVASAYSTTAAVVLYALVPIPYVSGLVYRRLGSRAV